MRPDGRFFRVGNFDGSLDDTSDEELTRLHTSGGRRDDDRRERACSDCGGQLLLHWYGPLGTGVWLALCADCEAHRPAAHAFIRWRRGVCQFTADLGCWWSVVARGQAALELVPVLTGGITKAVPQEVKL
ncbi:DUF6300 family protein [Streptomyces sp. NPDC085900]|uniref:DUF6300 family protein n=1 Tax=Streptomyces sp. NPDC085900 TaxID=3365737 RepID=UPI0037D3D11A